MKINSKLHYFLFFAIAAFIYRLLLASSLIEFTVFNDLNSFHIWGRNLAQNGPGNFYSDWSDYLPGYLYILWLLAILEHWLDSNLLSIRWDMLFKLPSMLSDIGSGLFIYLIAQKFTSQKKAFLTSIVFLFNPTFFANSTLWGQADSFMTVFLLSSFYYVLEGKFVMASIILGLAQIIKPIAILSIPIYLVYMLSKKIPLSKMASFSVILSTVVILAFIPFNNSDNILKFIFERHSITSNQYPYTSVNAFNFWSIFTKLWEPDKQIFLHISFHTWGYLLFGYFYLFLIGFLFWAKNKFDNSTQLLTYALALTYIGMFIFLTRMHERHIYYGLVYLSLLMPNFNIFSIVSILTLYLIHLMNLYYPYSQATANPLILNQTEIVFFSILNIVIFGYFLILFITKYSK